MTRLSLTLKAKVEAMEANALCPKCFKPFAGNVQYDHEIALAAGGKDHDEKPMTPLHKDCHLIKTTKDRKVIAKTKRQKLHHETGRSSAKKHVKKIQSPGFQTHLTKGFDGKVRPRKER